MGFYVVITGFLGFVGFKGLAGCRGCRLKFGASVLGSWEFRV